MAELTRKVQILILNHHKLRQDLPHSEHHDALTAKKVRTNVLCLGMWASTPIMLKVEVPRTQIRLVYKLRSSELTRNGSVETLRVIYTYMRYEKYIK